MKMSQYLQKYLFLLTQNSDMMVVGLPGFTLIPRELQRVAPGWFGQSSVGVAMFSTWDLLPHGLQDGWSAPFCRKDSCPASLLNGGSIVKVFPLPPSPLRPLLLTDCRSAVLATTLQGPNTTLAHFLDAY